MRTKIFVSFMLLFCGLLLFAFQLTTPSVSPPPNADTIEFSMQKVYLFNEVETPKVSKVMKAQMDTTSNRTVNPTTFWDIVKDNWGALLFAFLALVEIYIRATPTVSDNSIFNLLKKILDAIIPNKSTDGGVFP